MLKSINLEVAKAVGKSGAFLLNQLYLWYTTKHKDVIFRTDKGLLSDLGDIISLSTLRRAKKKLVEMGYITLSFAMGKNRPTHYSLTEKAKIALGMLKEEDVKKTNATVDTKTASEARTESLEVKDTQTPKGYIKVAVNANESNVEGVVCGVVVEAKALNTKATNVVKPKQQWIPKHLYAQHMKDKRKEELNNKEMVVSESMKQSFDEGFGNKNATKGIPEEALSKLPSWMLKKLNRS